MLSTISGFIFRALGWKIRGRYPSEIKKKILIVAPHTSNWDFPVGILFRTWKKHDIRFVAKKSVFKPPLGWLAKALGGISVDRKKSGNFLKGVIQLYKEHDALDICITPEGTRRRVEKFKTGFYYIARAAEIPILPIAFDFENKIFDIGEPFYPTDDAEGDIAQIESHYRGIMGRIPENSFF